MSRLDGRVAIVTGAAGGLGRAIAASLAERGAAVAAVDRADPTETALEIEKAGGTVTGAVADVADPAAVDGLVAVVHKTLGPVDIVVNNVAVVEKRPFREVTFEQWQATFAVNIHGYFLVTHAFLPDLERSAHARIINLTSTSPLLNVPLISPYITTKGAINGFTNSLATELGADGITVNSVAPSLVRTPATERVENAETDFAMLAQMQSLKTSQQPESVADAVAFLASDDAAFITGQMLVVDGGLTRR